MQLVFLFIVLIAPRPLLTLAERYIPGLKISEQTKSRVGPSLFFSVTSSGHFLQTAAMAEMVPPFVPYRRGLIYFTGVLEALGALGLWIPRLKRLTGLGLILMLVGLLPANVYAAYKRVKFGGHQNGPAYLLVRVPFQGLVMWCIYKAAVAPESE
jgi:uncharacterized membrane protein